MTVRMAARTVGLLGSAAVAVVLASQSAQAGGFALREQSAYGQGISFAGMAAGGSLSSMFWNPATLSAVMGFQTEAIFTGIFPDSDVDVTTLVTPVGPRPLNSVPGFTTARTEQGNIGIDALVPASYGAYRWNDKIILGVALNAPYGLATKYDLDSVLRTTGIAGTSEVFSLNANPNVAYQVNEYLTLAVGAQIQYLDARLTAINLGAFPAPGISSFEGDDIAFGVTAGIQVRPFEGTEIGLGYRSRVSHELDGEICRQANAVCADVTAEDFDLPDLVTLGIRQRIGESFTLAGTVEWTNWDRFQTVNVKDFVFSPVPGVTVPIANIPFEFEYNDGWFASIGAEYKINEQFAIRAGLGYEWSPLDDENRTFRLPDNDRLWASAGGSYTLSDRYSVDVGYSFIKAEDTEILADALGGPTANGPFSGEADSTVHIMSGAVKLKLGGEPAVEEPVVVKY